MQPANQHPQAGEECRHDIGNKQEREKRVCGLTACRCTKNSRDHLEDEYDDEIEQREVPYSDLRARPWKTAYFLKQVVTAVTKPMDASVLECVAGLGNLTRALMLEFGPHLATTRAPAAKR